MTPFFLFLGANCVLKARPGVTAAAAMYITAPIAADFKPNMIFHQAATLIDGLAAGDARATASSTQSPTQAG